MDITEQAIRNRLKGSQTLLGRVAEVDIFSSYRNLSANTPCIFFSISGSEGQNVGGKESMTMRLEVRSKTSKQDSWDIYTIVKGLLHNQEVSITDVNRIFHACYELSVTDSRFDIEMAAWFIEATYVIETSSYTYPTFKLAAIHPENSKETFDSIADLWSETSPANIISSIDTFDSEHPSVMEFHGKIWTLGDGYDLGDGLYLNDSPLGVNEGIYKDYAVSAYTQAIISFIYKTSVGSFDLEIYDGDTLLYISHPNDTVWTGKDVWINIPVGCTTIRVFMLLTNRHSGPVCVDDLFLSNNAILYDPDTYRRIPSNSGSFDETISGKGYFVRNGMRWQFDLAWNHNTSAMYDKLYTLLENNDMVYFDDGDVPPLTDIGYIYDTESESMTFYSITSPSSTNQAYVTNEGHVPVAIGDCETAEYSTANYAEITTDDTGYVESIKGTLGHYATHKFKFKSTIPHANVKRLRINIKCSGIEVPYHNEPVNGVYMFVWNGTTWQQVNVTTDSQINSITFATSNSTLAKQYVSGLDGYIRIILSTRSSIGISNKLRVYYVEAEINESLGRIVPLTNRALDIISVVNKTNVGTLVELTDYTLADDGRSITVIGQTHGDKIEVKYTRYFEVYIEDIPDVWSARDASRRNNTIRLRSLNS